MTGTTLRPPIVTVGPIAWLRQNLFSSWASSLVTLVIGAALIWLAQEIGQWAIGEARWSVVTNNVRLFLVGQYPGQQAWRLVLALTLFSALAGLSAGTFGRAARAMAITVSASQLLLAGLFLASPLGLVPVAAFTGNAVLVWIAFAAGTRHWVPRRALVIGWLVSLPLTFYLLAGFDGTPLPSVSSNAWGGLLLTLLIAIVGIVLSFPFGVLLALGRRSQLPVVRILSTGYIELVRGVPLVTILFMADIILLLFLRVYWIMDISRVYFFRESSVTVVTRRRMCPPTGIFSFNFYTYLLAERTRP